jgi:hypothetical protein
LRNPDQRREDQVLLIRAAGASVQRVQHCRRIAELPDGTSGAPDRIEAAL